MKYEYREVKCPWCDHVFMWNKDGGEGPFIHEYRLKSTGEYVEKTKCPSCEMDMLVVEHILSGIDTDDEMVEKV